MQLQYIPLQSQLMKATASVRKARHKIFMEILGFHYVYKSNTGGTQLKLSFPIIANTLQRAEA